MRHSWTHNDDILTFYLYRYGNEHLITKHSVSEFMGFDNTGSLNWRIGNFQAIDGKGGADHPANLSKEVFKEYLNVSKEDHRSKCFEIMGIKP